jgi:hypothetical protein
MFLSDLWVSRVPFQGSRAVVFGDLVDLFLRIEFSVAMLAVIQRIILVSMIEKNDDHGLQQVEAGCARMRLTVLTWIK